MKSVIKISVLLMLVVLASCKQEKFLEINGKVVGAETNRICLIKFGQDIRFDSVIKIPVKNGKFYYKTKIQYPEIVKLALEESVKKGFYSFMPLLLENEKIDLTIYDDEHFDKNIIKGGRFVKEYDSYLKKQKELNDKYFALEDSLNNLSKNNLYYSSEVKKLLVLLKKTKNKARKEKLIVKKNNLLADFSKSLTPHAKLFKDKQQSLDDEYLKYEQRYIEENQTFFSYYLLLNSIRGRPNTVDLALAKQYLQKQKKKNPNHPYNAILAELINPLENIKVGGRFVDFTLPDLKGKKHTLSNEIEGKVVLLDLWATWCGACIRKSQKMLPNLYNDFKDKDFVIVSVAGEFKNTKNLEKFLSKNNWPWLNLVELDKKNKIWQKYGVCGGGKIFLVDKKGFIIAINPTAEEVRKELEKRLK